MVHVALMVLYSSLQKKVQKRMALELSIQCLHVIQNHICSRITKISMVVEVQSVCGQLMKAKNFQKMRMVTIDTRQKRLGLVEVLMINLHSLDLCQVVKTIGIISAGQVQDFHGGQ